MDSVDDVQLPDLEVIQRYSLAVRGATAPRADVIAALQADLAWLSGGQRRRTPHPAAQQKPAVASPGPAATTKPGPATSATAKKAAATRPPANKAAATKAPASKTPASKTPAKKATAQKATAKRAAPTRGRAKAPAKSGARRA